MTIWVTAPVRVIVGAIPVVGGVGVFSSTVNSANVVATAVGAHLKMIGTPRVNYQPFFHISGLCADPQTPPTMMNLDAYVVS